MPQFKTLQFPNTPQGQSDKIRALEQHTAAGWRVVSETIVPGKFRGGQACCLFLIFAPCAFLAGHSNDIINVTLELPDKVPAFDRQKWAALLLYDKEVASAADVVRPLGPRWMDELAASYTALADSKYLPRIVENILDRAKQEQLANDAEMARQAELRAAEARERERVLAARKEQFDRVYDTLWGTNGRRAWTVVSFVAIVVILIAGGRYLFSGLNLAAAQSSTAENPAAQDGTDPAELARAYFTAWSDPADPNGDGIRPFYADRITYYGRPRTIEAVMAEKHTFARRWPSRRYTLRDSTMNVSCSSAGECKVVGVVDWDAENPQVGRHSIGSAKLRMSFSNGKIIGESSAVLSREKTAP